MALATVRIIDLLTVKTIAGNVPCAKIELTTHGRSKVQLRTTPLSDALNLDSERNFNNNLVPHLFPDIHYKMLHPAGIKCKTCAGKLESVTPACWKNDCPYTIKYDTDYPYFVSKHIPGNEWSFIMLRGMIEWHFDNKIFDCFFRGGTRVGMLFHHLTSDSSNDSYMGHRFVANSPHASVHSILNHAENKFNRISEQYRLSHAQKKAGLITQGTVVSLKRKRNVARIAMNKATDAVRDVAEAPNMASVMADYRHVIKQGQLYLPIPIGKHTITTFKKQNPKRTKEQMIAAGLL